MAAGIIPSSLADNPKGVLGGIQYGTNWQFNRIVLGLESDFSFSDIEGVANASHHSHAYRRH